MEDDKMRQLGEVANASKDLQGTFAELKASGTCRWTEVFCLLKTDGLEARQQAKIAWDSCDRDQ